jgi:hypothetical protein
MAKRHGMQDHQPLGLVSPNISSHDVLYSLGGSWGRDEVVLLPIKKVHLVGWLVSWGHPRVDKTGELILGYLRFRPPACVYRSSPSPCPWERSSGWSAHRQPGEGWL